jgi:hypothetical protein
LLQAIRVALASSGELNHLLRNQVCNRVVSIDQAKQLEHVLKDSTHRGSQFRLQTFPFEKAVNWHDKPPSSQAGGYYCNLFTWKPPVERYALHKLRLLCSQHTWIDAVRKSSAALTFPGKMDKAKGTARKIAGDVKDAARDATEK